jgi:hypothetical protein
MLFLRRYWTAVVTLFVVAVPALAQDVRKGPRQDVPPQPAQAFPLPDLEKLLPGGLDPAQAQRLRQQMEMTRRLLENLNKQLPGGFPGGPGGIGNIFGPGFPLALEGDNRLGARLQRPSEVLAEQLDLPQGRGLVLGEVKPGSPADRAGLKKHDILLELGGKAVSSQANDFLKVLNDFKTGDKVDAVVVRKARKESIKGVVLPEPPKDNPLPFGAGGIFPNFPVPVPNLQPPQPRGGRPRVGGRPGASPTGPLAVWDGKRDAVPTAYSGAVRIRALPIDEVQPGLFRPAAAGVALVILDVTAEPRMQGWSLAGTPNIARALDDQGQNLTVVEEPNPQANLNNPFGRVGVALGRMPSMSSTHQAAVRLKLGDKQAKAIKELTGTLSLQVWAASTAVLAVDNILRAAGQTTKGTNGSTLQILSIAKLADGGYSLRIKLETPGDRNNPLAGLGGFGAGGGVRIQQRIQLNGQNVVVAGSGSNDPGDLPVLLDPKGKAFTLVNTPSTVSRFNLNTMTQTRNLTLIYRPQEGQGEPARLVLNGRRRETVSVPFALRNVPLP